MEHTAIQPYQFMLDSAIAEWIAQRKTLGSARTAIEYERTIESFRQFLTPGGLDVLPIMAQSEQEVSRGNPKILAKIGNSVVEPLLKTVQTAEERGEIDKRNA